jgi:rhodanese-related sulfurtransferase/predicted transcriptional regulator
MTTASSGDSGRIALGWAKFKYSLESRSDAYNSAVALRDLLYPEYARIAQALASERRLELLELLGQAPRTVDTLATLTGLTIANVSQHLQILRRARLATPEHRGRARLYRLADARVMDLWLAVQAAARDQLAEVRAVLNDREGVAGSAVSRDDLEARLGTGDVTLIDVRPGVEFEHGHLEGAINMPLDDLPRRIGELPTGRPVVAYCRGLACLLADEAVELLRGHGLEAYRLDGGWPEWRAEGRPVYTVS